jgi:hypothetical protein
MCPSLAPRTLLRSALPLASLKDVHDIHDVHPVDPVGRSAPFEGPPALVVSSWLC